MRISTNSIARWREEVCRHLLTLDFEPASGAQFRGTMLPLMNANGVRVSQMGHTPGRAHRDHRLAKDGTDTVALMLATGGAIQVSRNGREVQLYRGGASLLRNWEPGAVALNREGGYTVVLIPNGLFQRCEAIDAFIGRRLPGTTALNLFKSYSPAQDRT